MRIPFAAVHLFALATAVAVAFAPARAEDDSALRKALLELNSLTGADPQRGKLKELLEAKPAQTKRLLAAAYEMSRDKDAQPFNRNATFLLAVAAENAKDVAVSAHFYRLNAKQCVELVSERGVALAYLGLIQMYQDNKRFADSEKACKEVLAIQSDEDGDLEGARPAIMRSLVTSIARQGQHERALKIVEDMIKVDGRNWLHLALKARVLRDGEKLEEAARTFQEVIKRVEKEDRLKDEVKQDYLDDYRYALSGVYVDLEQIDKAAAQLKTLLEREPNNPTYNNDLGFVWADRGMNLPEAEKHIRKAIEEDRKQRKASPLYDAAKDRDSPAYLDSLGWVLFKQGKAKEAKPLLMEALKERDGQHTEIYDHLAEVHLSLGEKAEAMAAWRRALEVVSETNKRDQKRKVEVEKKLKKHAEK